MNDGNPDLRPDPQDYLPPELQATWTVVPRASLKWLFIQAFLLGAGAGPTALSFLSENRAGWWALPAALLIMFVNGILMRRLEKRWLATLPKIECPRMEV